MLVLRAMACELDLDLFRLDVEQVFVQSDLEEHVFMRLPKQYEDKQEDTGTRPAGREKIYGKKRNTAKRTKQASKRTSFIATAFALPPLNSTKTNKNYLSMWGSAL